MNTLTMHDITKIEIETETFRHKGKETPFVKIRVNQKGGCDHREDFALNLFLDYENKFKALDMQNLFDIIQKHTVVVRRSSCDVQNTPYLTGNVRLLLSPVPISCHVVASFDS